MAPISLPIQTLKAFAVDSLFHVNLIAPSLLWLVDAWTWGSKMRLLDGRSIAIGFAAAISLVGLAGAEQASDIAVILDEARLIKMPDRVASVVVGNPAIADVAVQPGGWIVITGKGYGLTNLVALDRAGTILMEKMVEVQAPRDVLVVYRGGERTTYSCTPSCERRLTLGDSNTSFEVTAAQIGARNGLAASAPQTR